MANYCHISVKKWLIYKAQSGENTKNIMKWFVKNIVKNHEESIQQLKFFQNGIFLILRGNDILAHCLSGARKRA